MATLTVTIPAGSNAGATLRRLAFQIQQAAAGIPDATATGASTTFVLDNAPAAGIASVQVTGGPFTSALFFV